LNGLIKLTILSSHYRWYSNVNFIIKQLVEINSVKYLHYQLLDISCINCLATANSGNCRLYQLSIHCKFSMNSRFSQSQITFAVAAGTTRHARRCHRRDTRNDTRSCVQTGPTKRCRCRRSSRCDATRPFVCVVGAFDAAARGARVCVVQQRGEKWRCAEKNAPPRVLLSSR